MRRKVNSAKANAPAQPIVRRAALSNLRAARKFLVTSGVPRSFAPVMKLRPEAWFKFYAVVLISLMIGTWSGSLRAADAPPAAGNAPANTNAPADKAGSPGSKTSATNEIALVDEMPYLSFGLDGVEPLQARWFEVPIWQFLASLIYVFLAFLTARVIDWVLGIRLRKWAKRTPTKYDDIILELIRGPIKVVTFVVLLHIGLRIFRWPAWFTRFFSKSLHIIVALSITYILLKVIDVLVNYWKERAASHADDKKFDDQLLPILRNTMKVFVVIVAVLLTSQNLGLNITSLIASLSIGGLAIGLAAQDTLANLFGAVAVFADKPFRVGDRIRLDSVEGDVESIGMRSTRVRTPDGHLVTIPNKTVGNATITNIGRRPSIRTVMNLGLTHDTSTERLKSALQLLEEIYRSDPMTKDVIITFNRFADSALNIEVVHFWNGTDQLAYFRGLQALNLRVKEEFDRAGFEFAFPTQTLHVKEKPTAA